MRTVLPGTGLEGMREPLASRSWLTILLRGRRMLADAGRKELVPLQDLITGFELRFGVGGELRHDRGLCLPVCCI